MVNGAIYEWCTVGIIMEMNRELIQKQKMSQQRHRKILQKV